MTKPDQTKDQKNAKANQNGKRRRRKRRRLSAFACFLIGFVVLAAVGVSLCVYFLKIDKITTAGKTSYTQEQIVSASGLKMGDSAFLINRGRAAAAICSKLPYIGSAKICYNPLTGVTIEVKPDTAEFHVKCADGYAELDKDCKILEIVKDSAKFSSLTVINGIDAKKYSAGVKLPAKNVAQLLKVEQILSELKKNQISKITSIDVSNEYEIKANYDKRVDILIGTSSDLSYKMKFAAALLKNKNDISDTDKGLLDVSQSAQNDKVSFIPS
jgi:cell division septal protein FtsQ